MGLRLDDNRWDKWWAERGAAELSELFYWVWDPVGVTDAFPYTRDEYDSYVPGLGSRLKQDASIEEIAGYLATIERDWMGMRPNEARLLEVADAVDTWLDNSIGRWEEGL